MERQKKIELDLFSENNKVVLKITDDGSGIPDNVETKGMGLQIMNFRARMIDANLKIKCHDSKGTQVKKIFIIKYIRNRKMNEKKKNFIVEDHPIFRLGMSELINQESDLMVCGYADNVGEALKKIETLKRI